jgi:hypothetical protein
MTHGGETHTGRRSRRMLAPLAGVAHLAVAGADRLRRRRSKQTDGSRPLSLSN